MMFRIATIADIHATPSSATPAPSGGITKDMRKAGAGNELLQLFALFLLDAPFGGSVNIHAPHIWTAMAALYEWWMKVQINLTHDNVELCQSVSRRHSIQVATASRYKIKIPWLFLCSWMLSWAHINGDDVTLSSSRKSWKISSDSKNASYVII